MIKLEDLITLSYSNIIVMNGVFESLIIDVNRVKMSYLSKKLLDSEIEKMNATNNCIRVWLKEAE